MDASEHAAIKQHEAEIKDCVLRIVRGEQGDDLIHTARRLVELGVWTRGSVRPRGTVEAAAQCRLPTLGQEEAMIACLPRSDGPLRRQIVSALGQWGGQASATVIADLLPSLTDKDNQLYCIGSLETIGGPTAVAAFRWAYQVETLKHAAAHAARQLETGGAIDWSEGVSIPLRAPARK